MSPNYYTRVQMHNAPEVKRNIFLNQYELQIYITFSNINIHETQQFDINKQNAHV